MALDGEGQGFDPSHSGDFKQKYPERFGEVLEYKNISQSPEAVKRMFEVGIEKGYITRESVLDLISGMINFRKNKLFKLLEEKGLTFEVFSEVVSNTPRTDPSGAGVNLVGMVDKEIVSETATFGVSEPTYFELLGDDLDGLRKKKSPSCLLLGSFGPYSAEEFKRFVHKINSKAQISVLDNYQTQRKMMEEKFTGTDINFKFADVRKMPFEDESQDLMASDYLLRSFRNEKNVHECSKENFIKLFQEVSRVLKPGGAYILVDAPENLRGFGKTNGEFQETIAGFARLAGLELATVSDSFSYPLRKDVSSTMIDEEGVPKYKNLVAHDSVGRGFKFVKSKIKEE